LLFRAKTQQQPLLSKRHPVIFGNNIVLCLTINCAPKILGHRHLEMLGYRIASNDVRDAPEGSYIASDAQDIGPCERVCNRGYKAGRVTRRCGRIAAKNPLKKR
jgi:hypothetical protein